MTSSTAPVQHDDAEWLLREIADAEDAGVWTVKVHLDQARHIASRLSPTGLVEALDCWQTMIEAAIPIGGEWVAVRVAHSNDLHAALSNTSPAQPEDAK